MARRSRSSRRRKSSKPKLPTISLTLDQWLDLLGLGLVSLALLTFLSFLSTQGTLTGWWLDLLSAIFGWGVFVVPIGLGAIGLWLILRRFEDKRPKVEPEVVLGIIMAFLTALTTLHLLAGLFYDDELSALAEQGLGGGHIGFWLARALLNAVGIGGTVVLLLALWVIALTFSFGVSVVELGQAIGRVWVRLRERGTLFSRSKS